MIQNIDHVITKTLFETLNHLSTASKEANHLTVAPASACPLPSSII